MQTHKPTFYRLATAVLLLLGSMLSAQSTRSVVITWNANSESDLVGYTVRLGTSSGYHPDVRTVTTNSTLIAGLAPFTTYYCVVGAFNAHGLSGEFSAEFSFSTSSAGEWYSSWTSSAGLSGNNAFPSSIPAHDGVSNLLKFAFNLDPARSDLRILKSGSGTSGLPFYSLQRNGSILLFRVEYLRRKATDLQYTPTLTTDLRNFAPMAGTTYITSINNTWERVVTQQAVDPSSLEKLFGRVEVTLP